MNHIRTLEGKGGGMPFNLEVHDPPKLGKLLGFCVSHQFDGPMAQLMYPQGRGVWILCLLLQKVRVCYIRHDDSWQREKNVATDTLDGTQAVTSSKYMRAAIFLFSP